jgi:hypothetical protein
MGCGTSREDEYRRSRYEPYNPRTYPRPHDRDDYDDCCGCGPWYGGGTYRESRREWLPGYGSPPENRFGPGGYAGEYWQPGTASEMATEQMSGAPFRPEVGQRVLPPGIQGAFPPLMPPLVEGGIRPLPPLLPPGQGGVVIHPQGIPPGIPSGRPMYRM